MDAGPTKTAERKAPEVVFKLGSIAMAQTKREIKVSLISQLAAIATCRKVG
jgi:hypothetical protein